MKKLRNLQEFIERSHAMRNLSSYFLRALHHGEYGGLNEYISKNKKRIPFAINCRDPYQFEHIKEIFFYIKEHKFFCPFPFGIVKKSIQSKNNKFLKYFEDKYSLFYGKNYFSYIWLPLIKSRLFLEPTISSYSGLYRSSIKILCSHGISALGFSKNTKHIKYIGKYDYLFLTGPLQKKALLSAHKRYGGNLPEMIEIGFLRGDRLLQRKQDFNRDDFLRKIGFDNRFTVIFAPTWGEFSSTSEWIDNIVRICQELEVNLFIRLHPIMLRGMTKWQSGGINWNNKLSEILKTSQRTYIVLEDNIDDYLVAADTLITDVSSVGLEFMILKKKVFFIPCDNFFKLFGRDIPISWVRGELEVKDIKELKTGLMKTISCSREYFSYPQEIIYNPGKSMVAISDFFDKLNL